MRPIDADVVIKHIEEYWEMVKLGKPSRGMTAVIQNIKTIINSLPTVDAEPHWIPCSERFPEKDGYYLTTTCYRQVYCDFWNEDHFDRTEAVIAWMTLPKPYEVKE